MRFTALRRHITPQLLEASYHALKREAAPGVDGVTWQEYGRDLQTRLAGLHGRVHRGAYRAQPSLRAWIPKPDGRQRPLGIAALEDKIVQQAARTVLEQIYEEAFLGFSYGFRPRRGCHQALDALSVGLTKRKVNWVLDADIRGFFDAIDHDWLMKFLEHRIADRHRCTIAKRMRATLQAIKQQLRRRMHRPVNEVGAWLRSVVRGWLKYHAVPGNYRRLDQFRTQVERLWRHTLCRRSQRGRKRWTWPRFKRLARRWLPTPKILHPYPDQRFYATHPR